LIDNYSTYKDDKKTRIYPKQNLNQNKRICFCGSESETVVMVYSNIDFVIHCCKSCLDKMIKLIEEIRGVGYR